MKNQFDSGLMSIEIDGSTVRYSYNSDSDAEYEIRGVSAGDLSRLRVTNKSSRYSTSESVQWLTHEYKDSHYRAGTNEKVAPASTKKRKLTRTPWSE